MRTISYVSLFLLLLLTTACQFNTLHVTDASSTKLVAYEGIYKGTLPCADCAGIESKLILDKEGTFVYEQNYSGQENGRFTSSGKYTVQDKILTLQDNHTPIHFLIGDRVLFLLDNNKKPAQGELAPYYTLKKQENFTYPGRYETFSENKEAYKQVLSITPKGKDYQIDFSASKVGGVENCHFSGTAWLENGKLWANVSPDKDKEILMYIAPTHDNLGVEVFTPDFDERFSLMLYCKGGSSLAGEYIKNTITTDSVGVFNTSTTIEDVLHTLPLTQVYKTAGKGEFADEVYDDYEIWSSDGHHLFTLTPANNKGNDKTSKKIQRVLIQSPFFKTVKGIHRNSTYEDIKNAYTITRIVPDMEHVVLVVDELNANFTLPKTALETGWWNSATKTVDGDKIPPTAKTDSFILWWNL